MPISIPCCRVSASCKIAERNARPDLGNRRPRRKSDGDIRRHKPTPPSPELTGNWRVDWLGASRNVQPLIAALGGYTVPRLSPDGKNLAFIGFDSTPQIYDLERETFTPITNRSNNRASFDKSRN